MGEGKRKVAHLKCLAVQRMENSCEVNGSHARTEYG